jgi:acetoacetyl-CoA reductase
MTASSGILAMPPDIVDAWTPAMPTGELVRTEDIADAVAFFARAEAGKVTGQELVVDGGAALNTRSVTSSAVRA